MKHWIGELIGLDLHELRGARLSGSFPFSETLVNRVCAESLTAHSAISGISVEFHDGDRVTARVKLRAPFVPPLTVQAWVERQPDPARSMPLVLGWSIRGLGPAALVAPVVLRRFAELPPWIQLEADTVAVDVGGLIGARGFPEIVPFVSDLHVSMAEGRLTLKFELRTPPAPA